MFGHGAGNHFRRGAGSGKIQLNHATRASQLLDFSGCSGRTRSIAIGDSHARAFTRKRQRNRPAQSLRGARYQNHFSVERKRHESDCNTSSPAGTYRLRYASDRDKLCNLAGKSKTKRRSGCPVSIALEMLGDRWTLLIIRDLMVRGLQTFTEFREGGEKIATNILADRLRRLEQKQIITANVEKGDGRKLNYRLTEKGIDLAPLLLELLIWGARHEETGAPPAVIKKIAQNSGEFLAEVRRRWRDRDMTPALPKFGDGGTARQLRKGVFA